MQVRVSSGCGREEESSKEVGEANLVFFYCFFLVVCLMMEWEKHACVGKVNFSFCVF